MHEGGVSVWNTLKEGGNKGFKKGASWVKGLVPWKGRGLELPYELWEPNVVKEIGHEILVKMELASPTLQLGMGE